MNISIRKETEKDYEISEFVTQEAFKGEEHSNHNEKEAVARLRKSDSFISELALVAEVNDKIVGFIMYTKLFIKNDDKEHISLSLAPVAVLPEYQSNKIGSKLIYESLKIAKEIGYKSVIVVGHEKFYPRFGFRPASIWGLKPSFEVPHESFMALELEDNGLKGVTGTVIYAKEFFE